MNIYIDYVRYKSIPNRSFGTILDQSPYQNVTLTQGKSIPFQLPRVSHICAGFQGSCEWFDSVRGWPDNDGGCGTLHARFIPALHATSFQSSNVYLRSNTSRTWKKDRLPGTVLRAGIEPAPRDECIISTLFIRIPRSTH